MNECKQILNVIDEVQKNIQELFFSGFNTPGDFVIDEFLRLGLVLESCGMSYGSQKLNSIHDKLKSKRHSFDFNYSECIKEYCELNEYCIICKKRLNILNLKTKISS
ncbi:hypothetical protein [Clostridium coskatii]|uniref:Uncharacterized protein n=1 Tax=Clostridium coskatii TaxID=1705578 RepID=A0A162L288_9CLOT|nr:hypothetical protein [Clostridium coskatii]OAA87546.1 hypothetical protein WX73_02728 [Clostridium coskatii]OBR96446.1 hypothetical protein CLCOS_08840 [Clostridium coskatii]